MKQFSAGGLQLSAMNLSKRFFYVFAAMLVACCFTLAALAQQDDLQNTAPPPLKILSKEEVKQLNAETDAKKRTKLGLDLMENRLKKAEELAAQQKYTEMFDQLGAFNALIDNTLEFLNHSNDGNNKTFYNYKRVEITLREFLPRLELIRRELPIRYEFYVRNLAKTVRDARSKAIDPLFGDTVIKNNDKN